MIKNAVNMSCHVMSCHVMSCHVMSCHVANHLNFSLFSIAKIFSLNQFIFCPFFAGILKTLIAYIEESLFSYKKIKFKRRFLE